MITFLFTFAPFSLLPRVYHSSTCDVLQLLPQTSLNTKSPNTLVHLGLQGPPSSVPTRALDTRTSPLPPSSIPSTAVLSGRVPMQTTLAGVEC